MSYTFSSLFDTWNIHFWHCLLSLALLFVIFVDRSSTCKIVDGDNIHVRRAEAGRDGGLLSSIATTSSLKYNKVESIDDVLARDRSMCRPYLELEMIIIVTACTNGAWRLGFGISSFGIRESGTHWSTGTGDRRDSKFKKWDINSCTTSWEHQPTLMIFKWNNTRSIVAALYRCRDYPHHSGCLPTSILHSGNKVKRWKWSQKQKDHLNPFWANKK